MKKIKKDNKPKDDSEIIEKLKQYNLRNEKILENKYSIINDKRIYRNILITDRTGYFVMQLVYSIMHLNSHSNVHLIVAESKRESALERVIAKLNFYFGIEFYNNYKHRIFVYNGDMTKENFNLDKNEYNEIHSKADCIINCIENTTYYGNYEDSYKINVQCVRNLVNFAKTIPNIVIEHISTLLVAFGVIEGKDRFVFTEDDINVGQRDNNSYFRTKLEAEEIIEDARKYGIKTNIFRIGNLVYNSCILKFQENVAESPLYSLLKSFINMKMIPSFSKEIIDFSFVDKVCEALLLIYDKNTLMNGIYHLYNPNRISTNSIFKYLQEYGYKDLKLVNIRDIFNSFENEAMRDDIMNITVHGGLLGNVRGTDFEIQSDRTQSILKVLGFVWNKVGYSQFAEILDYCREVQFIE